MWPMDAYTTAAALLSDPRDPETTDALRELASTIDAAGVDWVAAGRVVDAAVCAAAPLAGLRALFASGLGAVLLPEIAALDLDGRVRADGTTRHKDNLDHSLRVCAQTPARRRARWAALLHDIGKAPTRRLAAGKVTFYGHEAVGARLTRERLTAYGFDTSFVSEVATLVETSGRIHGWMDENWDDAAVRRWVRDIGDDLVVDALDVARADCTSARPGRCAQVRAEVDAFQERIDEVAAADAERARRPALDGDAIAATLGIAPGPQLGQAWRWLRDWTAAHTDATVDEARAALVAWWAQR